MNDNLTQTLARNYPIIFSELGKSPQESCMAFGIECGDGWYSVLDVLCASLSNLYSTGIRLGDQRYVPLDPPHVVATQIKEKFGSLRFYYRLSLSDEVKAFQEGTDEKVIAEIDAWARNYIHYIDGMIALAEVISARTCEITGKNAEMHRTSSGWYKTLNTEYVINNSELASRYTPVKCLKELV